MTESNAHAGVPEDEMVQPNEGKGLGHSLSFVGQEREIVTEFAKWWLEVQCEHPILELEMRHEERIAHFTWLLDWAVKLRPRA